jgi:hypothetical protein
MLLIMHVAHEYSSVLGQAKTDEIDGIGKIISSQESQNTRSLVIGQAFFEYSLLSLSHMACLLSNDYSTQFILFFSPTHPEVCQSQVGMECGGYRQDWYALGTY